MTPTNLLTELRETQERVQRAVAQQTDPLDFPASWTERERRAAHGRLRLGSQLRGWVARLIEQHGKAAATRESLTPRRDRLLAAQAAIKHQLANASDRRTITDSRGQHREWERQNALAASLTATTNGVPYVNGQPLLPSPLRD